MFSWTENKLKAVKSSVVADSEITSKSEKNTAFIKDVLIFVDGSLLRFMEFIDKRNNLHRYRFHWTDAKNKMIKRWDNAPHHEEISSFPHHVHVGGKTKAKASNEVTLENIIRTIEYELLK